MSDKFEQWAIVELFGHNVIAGKVSEQTIGGQSFVRVDVPETEGQPAFTKLYGGSAIYALTPTDEQTALAAVQGLRVKPIEVWKLNLPQLSAHMPGPPEDDYCGDDDEPDIDFDDDLTEDAQDDDDLDAIDTEKVPA